MTPETPNIPIKEKRACWLSVDILTEHFPHLKREIWMLDDAEIAYIDKKARKMFIRSYWVAMEIVIKEYLEEKKKENSKVDESFESGFE